MNDNYISTTMGRVTKNGFGLSLVKNLDGNYSEEFKIYRDPNGGYWTTGAFGTNFGIELVIPNDAKRYKAVTAVDGRNILNGEKSSGSSRETGYVLTPPSSMGGNVITGWRKDSDSVNNFVLAEPEYSYAVMTGSSENEVGVIAVRFFSELKELPPPRCLCLKAEQPVEEEVEEWEQVTDSRLNLKLLPQPSPLTPL